MTIKSVAHLSDIHIPKVHKRHQEYRMVFDNTCNKLSELNPDRITIVGDLFHDKLNISNEANMLAAEFLNKLSSIAPVRITRGNHDCYGRGHEILTKNGWISFDDYINNNLVLEVMSFNQETKEFNFEYPIESIKKEYNGEMIRIRSSKVDMLVTPTHEVLKRNTYGTFSKVQAKDIKTKNDYIPLIGDKHPFENDLWYELLGFTFADGTLVIKNEETKTGRVQFHLKKARKITYITNLLKKLNIEFTLTDGDKAKGSKKISIYSDVARDIFEFFDFDKSKPLKWTLINEPKTCLRGFIDGYLSGDGCEIASNVFSCVNINYNHRLIITTACRIVGYFSNTSDNEIFGNYENSKQQHLFYINRKNVNKTQVKEVVAEKYDDYVYCLTVPSSNLLIRNNGTVFIGGNCNILRKDRLDSVQALVNLIQNPNITYYNKSGFYVDDNVIWVVWHHGDHFSPWNELFNPTPENEPSFYHEGIVNLFDKYGSLAEIRKEFKFIDLYHDPVNGCKMFNGMELTKDSYLSINDFHGDYAMLGDIHLRQGYTRNGQNFLKN
jgi:hypothetical protein